MNKGMTRRTFIKCGGAAATAVTVFGIFRVRNVFAANNLLNHDPRPGDASVSVIRTGCFMCNAGCGLQVRVQNGVAIKIEGNPLCPHTNDWSAATRPTEPAARLQGTAICARGNGGLMTAYDPHRLLQPLKRVGPRGSGRWQSITWRQALEELAEGGELPDAIGVMRPFVGLRAIRGVPDSSGRAAELMDASDTAFAAEAKGGVPSAFGRKANRYQWLRGRDQIAEFTKRFNDSYGTVNHLEHSSTCNTAFALPMKLSFPKPKAPKTNYFNAELNTVDYLVLIGTNPLAANVGTPYWSRKLMQMKARGGKMVVIDPFFTATAAKADWWIPIKPGTDGALLLGMMRWLMENGRLDATYLSAPNETVATGSSPKYLNWTDASYLLEFDEHGEPHGYLDSSMAGGPGFVSTTLTGAITTSTTKIPLADASGLAAKGIVRIGSEFIYYPVKNGNELGDDTKPCVRAVLNSSAAAASAGATVVAAVMVRRPSDGAVVPAADMTGSATLDFAGTVGGHPVKTVYRTLKDVAFERTMAEWSALCEVPVASIERLAREVSEPGLRSCIEGYRGLWAHTNGQVTSLTLNVMNALLGRIDRVGGFCTNTRYGTREPSRPVSSSLTSGVRRDRSGSKYEGTLPVPTRQWYPVAAVVSQEVLPSAALGYPYKCLATAFYTANPAYTYPSSQGQRDAMVKADAGGAYAIPLLFTSTIFMDETAASCDYVLPDSSYLERYSSPFTSYAVVKTRSGIIRRPVIGSYRDVTIQGRAARIYIPATSSLTGSSFASVEDLVAAWSGPMPYDEWLVQLAKKLGLPNFGENGMGSGSHLDTAYQFWNAAFAAGNYGDLGNEGASGLPGDSTSVAMREGGKWDDPSVVEDATNPGWVPSSFRYGDLITLFAEKTSHYVDFLRGHHYPSLPMYEEPGLTLRGNHQAAGAQFPFTLLTYKLAWHVQARSTSNQWLRELQPDGYIHVAAADAERLGIVTGMTVRIVSPEGRQTEGTVKVSEGLRPGCVMVDHHFGRSWMGSSPILVDGTPRPANPAIGVGPDRNNVQDGDSDFPDICLTEPVSGQASYFDNRVNLVRV